MLNIIYLEDVLAFYFKLKLLYFNPYRLELNF